MISAKEIIEQEREKLKERRETARRSGKGTIIKYNKDYIDICKRIEPKLTANEQQLLQGFLYIGIEKTYEEDLTRDISKVIWEYIDRLDLKGVAILVSDLLENKKIPR